MKKSYIAVLLFSLLFSFSAYAQKTDRFSNLEIIPDTEEQSDFTGNMRISKETGVPVALYNVNYKVRPASPEEMAREYLRNNYFQLRLKEDLSDLVFSSMTENQAGYHVRFQQLYHGYPVFRATIVVNISHANVVYFVMNSYKPEMPVKDAEPFNPSLLVSESQALSSAKNYLQVKGSTQLEKVEPVVFYNNGIFRLARQVTVVPSEDVFGDWQVMVDAKSGEIFRVEDRSCKLHNHPGGESRVNGSGWVFAPNPITRARTSYGQPGFVDGNDADTDSLTAQLQQVILKDILFETSTNKYTLRNNWAAIYDFEAPYTGLHQLDSSNFHFKRAHDNFEAVNTFHSIAAVMSWLNDSLSLNIHPFQYTGGVQFDPHGLNGDDNSHYVPATGRVAFGDGGVDDAEDPYVVVHELGHGLHDWATNGGLSQVQGLSEGCGDYIGMSYERSFNCLPPSHPAYNYAFNWDGHNPFWAGRITNYAPLWPGGLVGQIHTDGQMWASTLMTIYDQIGRTATDKNFITCLTMLNASSNQRDAAMAFLQADQLNYGGSHSAVIGAAFVARGYITGPVTAEFSANPTGGQAPLTVQFTDLSTTTTSITSWEWDFNNDGVVDATVQNPQYVYTASGVYSVKLTVSDGTNTSTKLKTNYISVNSGVLVWEGVANGVNYSGAFIRDYLQQNNYEVSYTTTLPSSLLGYEAAFLSFGNYGSGGSGRTQFTADMANIVKSYLQAGGKVYLEGGDALGYDQVSNSALLSLFGISSGTDGSTQVITSLAGQSGLITQGMLFTGSTQTLNTYIDKFVAGGTGAIAFIEGTYGNVAVQNPGTGTHKTFCFSYALAHLNDGTAPTTRAALLDKIITFFEVQPIPVELTSFSVSSVNGSANLSWETASEVNNKGFFIERKNKNSGAFESLTFISGKGTTTEKTKYNWIDAVEPGVYVYRLRQVDLDGTVSYSNEAEIDLTVPVLYSLDQNYPNPFNPSTSIRYSIEKDGMVNLTLYNLLGEKIVVLVSQELKAGNHEVKFDASGLPSGMYIYRLESGSFTASRKMILSK